VPTTGLVADLRRVKSAAEVARIEAAAAIADEALDRLRPQLLDGPTEQEFATALERTMIDLGADERSFPTICAAGPNSARPHAEPGNRPISEGDLVVIDFGALVDGYHSDMTRTIPVGEVAPDVRNLVAVATESQAAGAAAVHPGVTAHAVDRACRDVLAGHGLEDLLLHGTGHGLGLEIHETPILRPDGAEELREGEVVTVEPGVYLPGTGGARVEDTVVVTATGSRPLTRFPKDADGHLDR
jgi:Xaa-Pro aminopeptidase